MIYVKTKDLKGLIKQRTSRISDPRSESQVAELTGLWDRLLYKKNGQKPLHNRRPCDDGGFRLIVCIAPDI